MLLDVRPIAKVGMLYLALSPPLPLSGYGLRTQILSTPNSTIQYSNSFKTISSTRTKKFINQDETLGSGFQQSGDFSGIGLMYLFDDILAFGFIETGGLLVTYSKGFIYESQNVRPGKEVHKKWLLKGLS